MTTTVSDEVEFPISKRTVPNRLVKAALTECLADPNTSQPNDKHFTLYSQWGQGGGDRCCGIIMSGNVMVDRLHRESARNIVLDTNSDLTAFSKWAECIHGTFNNNDKNNNKPLAVMQISHPGRQCPLAATRYEVTPVSSSSAQQARLAMPGALGELFGTLFVRPARALETKEMPALVEKYVTAAKLAEQAGWDGVEIHAAHGYLLSQFLSPSANQRDDAYGGSPQQRKKILLEVIAAVRKATSSNFVVGIKVNTKDRTTEGQKREDETIALIQELSNLEKLDFIELSGGGFEDAIFVNSKKIDASGSGGGYFGSFADRLQKQLETTAKSPKIILTGGFRTKAGMEQAFQEQMCDMIGLGRPMIANPQFAKELLAAKSTDQVQANLVPLETPVFKPLLEAALNSLWYHRQIERLSIGQLPDPNLSYVYTLAVTFFVTYIWDFDFHGHAAYAAKKRVEKNKDM